MSKVPEFLENQEKPEFLEIPEKPEVPGVPGVPGVPRVPGVPGVPPRFRGETYNCCISLANTSSFMSKGA